MQKDAGMTAKQRMNADIRDIRTLFGNKYDRGIKEMRDYAKTLEKYKK